MRLNDGMVLKIMTKMLTENYSNKRVENNWNLQVNVPLGMLHYTGYAEGYMHILECEVKLNENHFLEYILTSN